MRIKKISCLSLLLLVFSLVSYGQHKAINKDTSRKHIDSLISNYEAQGFKLYSDSMYYSAIDKYTLAGDLQYTLLKKTHKFSYATDYTVTMCNIAICDYKMCCFQQSLNVINDIQTRWGPEANGGDENFDYHKYDWSKTVAFVEATRVSAYIGLCMGSCYFAMRVDQSVGTHTAGLYNLYVAGKFPDDGVLAYTYGINSYSYKSVYTDIGDYFKDRGDTVKSKYYYAKSDRIDSARIQWDGILNTRKKK